MQRIHFQQAHRLFDVAATRQLEQHAAAALQPHALMQRAGLALARLSLALAPHARKVWVACGPGNNGGDGMEAAMHLQRYGKFPVVTWLGDESKAPRDALASLERARRAGVAFAHSPPADLDGNDLCIDALFGIGNLRGIEGRAADWVERLNSGSAQVLAADLPSGLNADTGAILARDGAAAGACVVRARHTLSLLTLKPGLFTAQGRDAAGQVWLDDLGVDSAACAETATLLGAPLLPQRLHASHKGSYGDLVVVGGAAGMSGAALLAARAALHAGAGRVYVALLCAGAPVLDAAQPELMLRDFDSLDLAGKTLVCGCGGGDSVRAVLPRAMAAPSALVLDADALNGIASDAQLQALLVARGRRARFTVLTPHPLEAARLLDCPAAQVQADRLGAAQQLVDRFACAVVLKGSGTVIAAPGHRPCINPSGNARLASAGTGDVLAGMVGAALAAAGQAPFAAVCAAVYRHGQLADAWPGDSSLTAAQLPSRLGCS